ncbi:MAG: flavin reductase family protein [Candidatus Solibacter usitatus]|nr:flavin reductase family protein [Candidatus Solibacter usitatus]
MTVDPTQHESRDVYKLLIGSVVPRPIGFISSVSADGVRNLAPFSFFNAVCQNPPTVIFSAGLKGASSADKRKDTLRNVQETGEFVVNIVGSDIAAAMNTTSGDYAPEIDEFEVAGLTPIASETVRPARVKECRVQMECRATQFVTVSDKPGGACIVVGEVVRIHVDDGIVDGYKIDPAKLDAIGRMGGNTYARTTDRFDLERPVVK